MDAVGSVEMKIDFFHLNFSKFILRNTSTHFNPAVIFIQSRLKKPVKLSNGQLFRIIRSDHRCMGFDGIHSFFVHYFTKIRHIFKLFQ